MRFYALKAGLRFCLPLLLSALCACTEGAGEVVGLEKTQPALTVVFSVNGLGDMGYNDDLLNGVLGFRATHADEIDLTLVSPRTAEQSRLTFQDWLARAGEAAPVPRMLVLAGSEYETMLAEAEPALSEGNTILLLESRRKEWPRGVAALDMQLYGISYVAGRLMAGTGRTRAMAVLAMPGHPQLEGALRGLTAGMEATDGAESCPEVRYLAPDEEGFSRVDSAFSLISTLKMEDARRTFVYPLCGGAALGIYRYLNDRTYPAVVGMDCDCSLLCPDVPFSVVKDVGHILQDALEGWLRGDTLPMHRTYGLKDGYLHIKNNTIKKQRYDWEAMAEAVMEEAVAEEEAYEKEESAE